MNEFNIRLLTNNYPVLINLWETLSNAGIEYQDIHVQFRTGIITFSRELYTEEEAQDALLKLGFESVLFTGWD